MSVTADATMDQKIALTQWISDTNKGNKQAEEALFCFVYAKLKLIARRTRRGWPKTNNLDTTALVHEFFLKYSRAAGPDVTSREHFFNLAAKMMRQIVINHAKMKIAEKRGGRDASSVDLTDRMVIDVDSPESLVLVDQLLSSLEKQNELAANVFICKRYAKLANHEIAEALDVSVSTVKRYLTYANAYLTRHMSDGDT